ncbi:MAG: acyl-CoA dehydrogenase family protein, partial [Thermoplasmata archaeon]|nr:acyl-CoA dehydrogenase family protein [Thermoplasmata archaeon]
MSPALCCEPPVTGGNPITEVTVASSSMDFSLTDEERAFQEAVRHFGDKVLRSHERQIDREGRIPKEVLQGMAQLGLLAMPVPEAYGGMGGSA